MRVHDAVIVGAGPAGSTLASLLARDGYDVLLLDRYTFPRPKPCGESLNPGAVQRLGELGLLDAVVRLPHTRIGGWTIQPDRGPPLHCDFANGHCGIAVDRGAFDHLLLDAAIERGASLRIAHVTDLLTRDGRVTGVRTATGEGHRGRIVVGADGLRSVVVRRTGLIRRRPRLRKIALTAHLRCDRSPLGRGVLEVRGRTCLGIVSVGESIVNAVLVLPRAEACGTRSEVDSTFDDAVARSPHLGGAVRCSPVRATGPFDWPTRGVTAPGVLLVGDAAGYFDPFTGQGIQHALLGAVVAGRVVDESFRQPSHAPSAMEAYGRWHAQAAARALRVQRLIEFGLARPPLFDAAVSVLRHVPPVARRLLALIGDVDPEPFAPLGRGVAPVLP